MLQQQGTYNDLSEKLREELLTKIESLGKRVRFKFAISKPNPDPQKYNGETIYPFLYTLDPKTFQITDPYDKNKGKRIGIVDKMDDRGNPTVFKCIRVGERHRGVYELDLENPDQLEYCAYLLLHPKFADGKFQDKTKQPVVSLIDENRLATEQRTFRSTKLMALNFAAKMSEREVVEFADAMSWDSTEDISILRNKIEDLAEHTPDIFNDLTNSDKMKFQTVVKQALDNKVIVYDPIANKISWVSTGQPIAQLGGDMDKGEVERAAEWFQLGGDKATKAFDKVKSLMKKELI